MAAGVSPHSMPPLTLLQVFILNGATYDQRFLDAIRTSSLSRADSSNPDSVVALNADLDDCALLTNNKGKPLLASLAGGKMTAEGRLLIQAVVSGMQGWRAAWGAALYPQRACVHRCVTCKQFSAAARVHEHTRPSAVPPTLPCPVLSCVVPCCAVLRPCSVGAWCCRTWL